MTAVSLPSEEVPAVSLDIWAPEGHTASVLHGRSRVSLRRPIYTPGRWHWGLGEDKAKLRKGPVNPTASE